MGEESASVVTPDCCMTSLQHHVTSAATVGKQIKSNTIQQNSSTDRSDSRDKHIKNGGEGCNEFASNQVTSEINEQIRSTIINQQNNNIDINENREKCKKDEDDESDDSEFECVLGGNGQVVLWSSKYESILSRFEFTEPKYLLDKKLLEVDEDILSEPELNFIKKDGVVIIEHEISGTVDFVGEQIWRGALFLADFILHNPRIFYKKQILEIASGVGLTSIIAGNLAKQVTITDVDRGNILELVNRNVKRNNDNLSADIQVRELDFYNHQTIDCMIDSIRNTHIILAADVIYENQLTDGFFDTVLRILSEPPNKVLYVALEKRCPVYSEGNLEPDYPLYEYFLEKINWIQYQKPEKIEWTVEQIKSDFPRYFFYEPSELLVLWKIQANLKVI